MTPQLGRPLLCPTMIGREKYLDVVEQSLADLHVGRGTIVVLSGEAGIGKTRLARELATLARSRGFEVVRGACFEPDRQLPYAPLVEVVREILLRLSDEDVARLHLSPGLGDVFKLVPDLARQPLDSAVGDADQDQRRLFYALSGLLERTAAQQATLLIIEDLHWSDDATLQFLLFLARRVPAQSILLVLTYRSDEPHEGLVHCLAELQRERRAIELRLEPLSAAEVVAVLRCIFDLPPSSHPALADELYQLTEGNPFFIEEVLGSLATAGHLTCVRGRWDRTRLAGAWVPRTIHDAVSRRVRLLSDPARRTLELAAVAGRRFDFSLLHSLTGCDEQALVQHLRELMRAQLVVEEDADRFVFRHALTRQAILGDLLGHERRALHAEVARALEQRAAIGASEMQLEDLAYHTFEAERWGKAIEFGQLAGQRAQSLHAPRAAVDHFSRAVQAANRLAQSPPLRLLLERAAAYELMGWFEAAADDYLAALRSARATSDVRGECEASLNFGLLWAGRDYTRAGEHYRRALELAQTLDDAVLQARCLNRLGNWHLNQGRTHEALAHHHRAERALRDSGETRALVETQDLLGLASSMAGDLLAGREWFERSIQLARQLEDPRALASGLSMLALLSGSYLHETVPTADIPVDQVRHHLDEALRITRATGWRAGEAFVLLSAGLGLGPRGALGDALANLTSSLAVADEIEHHQWAAAARVALGALHLDLLDFHLARHYLEDGLARAQALGSAHWTHAATALLVTTLDSVGEKQRASALLDSALPPAGALQTRGLQLLCFAAAEQAVRHGEPERVLQILGRLIASAPKIYEGREVPRLCKLRGEALLGLGELDAAEATLLAGLHSSDRAEARSVAWRIELTLGKLRRARGARREADECFASVRGRVADLARSLPEGPARDGFVQRLAKFVPPERPPSARRAAREAAGGLSQREQEVALLVARGCTNREIAEHLVITEHTAERHVENILAKLGLTSRVQLAAWTVEIRLAQPTSYGT